MKKLLLIILLLTALPMFSVGQTWAWAKQGHMLNNKYTSNSAASVTADKYGNIYAVGGCSDTTIIGNDTISCLPAVGASYLSKFDSTGKTIWVLGFNGSVGYAPCSTVTTDSAGYIYIVGSFIDTLTIGGFKAYTNKNNTVFVAKISPAGKVHWLKQANNLGNGNSIAWSVAADKHCNIYVTGNFYNTV